MEPLIIIVVLILLGLFLSKRKESDNLAERLEIQTFKANYLAMNYSCQIREYRNWLANYKAAKDLWTKENFRQIDESIEREKSLLGRGSNLFRSSVIEPAMNEYALGNPNYKKFIMYSILLESIKPPRRDYS